MLASLMHCLQFKFTIDCWISHYLENQDLKIFSQMSLPTSQKPSALLNLQETNFLQAKPQQRDADWTRGTAIKFYKSLRISYKVEFNQVLVNKEGFWGKALNQLKDNLQKFLFFSTKSCCKAYSSMNIQLINLLKVGEERAPQNWVILNFTDPFFMFVCFFH